MFVYCIQNFLWSFHFSMSRYGELNLIAFLISTKTKQETFNYPFPSQILNKGHRKRVLSHFFLVINETPFSFLTSRLYSSKGSLGCVQRLNIYVKPTRQISSWQKPLANKTKKWKISWKWRLHSQRGKNNVSSNLFSY